MTENWGVAVFRAMSRCLIKQCFDLEDRLDHQDYQWMIRKLKRCNQLNQFERQHETPA